MIFRRFGSGLIIVLAIGSQTVIAQSDTDVANCFDRLYAAAEQWEKQDSFIRAISHYDAARACPDATREQDSRARQRANEARLQWEKQLKDQISRARQAEAEAVDSANSAIRARAFAEAESQRARRLQKQAIRSARASEAGRLALEADEETDILLSTNSDDEERKQDALMAAYWAMRWAGDTLQTEVTRSFGNAVYLSSRSDYNGHGAMGVRFDDAGASYLMSRYGGTRVVRSDGSIYTLPGKGYTNEIVMDTRKSQVVTVGESDVGYWGEGAAHRVSEGVEFNTSLTSHAMSAESGLFAAGGRDGAVMVWSDPSQVRRLEGHTAPITHVEFNEAKGNDVRILSVSRDKTVRIWTATGSSVGIPPLEAQVIKAFFIDKSRVAIISGQDVFVWDADESFDSAVRLTHDHLVVDAGLAGNGEELITLEIDGVADLWSIEGEEMKSLPLFGGEAMGLMRLADNRWGAWSRPGNIAFFGDKLNIMEGALNVQSNLREIIVSPSGEYFISVGRDRGIALWDADGIEWMRPPRFDGHVWAAGFSPDETQLWASSRNGGGDIVWICPMPNLVYANMVKDDIVPDKGQARRFKMSLEIPD